MFGARETGEMSGEIFEQDGVRLLLTEALAFLRGLETASVDAVITDPPYSSGGLHRSARIQPPARKYIHGGTRRFEHSGFDGDSRDQRSWIAWCTLWLTECFRVVRPGGYCLMFTDWRQLPSATDALQAAGWTWRGVVAWDKGRGSRAPHKGYFRHQCEYVVWGSRGALPAATHGGPWPGLVTCPVLQRDKHHIVGKPLALMRSLVQVVEPGGLILDPFAGSGTTLLAAVEEGRRALGCEIGREHFDVAAERLAAARRPLEAVEAGPWPSWRRADPRPDLGPDRAPPNETI